MHYYKIKSGNHPVREISQMRIESDSMKDEPWRQIDEKGVERNFAVCPACDNPIQIIGLYRRSENSPKPYGKHTGKRIDGFPYFHLEDYEDCPYYSSKPNFSRVRKRARVSPVTLKILQIIRDKFDIIIEMIESFSGFSISHSLASRMLEEFMNGEGYLYVDMHLQNIPWMFAFRTANHDLFRQRVNDPDLRNSILENVNHAFIDDYKRLSKNPAGGFYKVHFYYIHHNRSKIDDVLQENIKLVFASSGFNKEKKPFWNKIIDFDYAEQNRLFTTAISQSERSTQMRSRAKHIIDQRFPNLDQMITDNAE